MNKMFEKDLYRYYGGGGETFKAKILRPPQLKYLSLLRRCSVTNNKLLKFILRWKLKRLQEKTLIQIPYETQIGEGLYIGHYGRIIVNEKAIIGKNVNIATGVVIGQENRGERKGSPIISNNVWIGANAVIVGGIRVGTDVLIAPNSFVNFNVPDHSIVVGNPARIICKNGATEEYICNTI